MPTARRLAHGWRRDSFDPADPLLRIHRGLFGPAPLDDLQDLSTSPDMPPVYDQEQEGSCTGHSVAAGFDFAHSSLHGHFLVPSRQAIYYDERLMEGDVDQDGGAEIRDGIKVVMSGVGPESLWPYAESNMFTAPSPAYRASATSTKCLSRSRVSQADYYIGHCLQYLRRPICFGFDCFPALESDEVAATGVLPVPGKMESSVGGHAVLLVGRDVKNDQYIVRNSWGKEWGRGGYFRMPRAYVLSPQLASDFWVIETVS